MINNLSRYLLPAVLLMLVSSACEPEANSITTQSVPAAAAPGEVWKPSGLFPWQIQFSGEIDTQVEANLFDLDGYETSRDEVAQLHSQNRKVICYINAGAWEDWRPDKDLFPPEIIGREYAGWEGERWLDIRQIQTLGPLLISRLEMCRQKGFDGVEFDNLDGYANETGFPLTSEDQLRFNTWLAGQAHRFGLAAGLKNDPEQAEELAPFFDFAITESCFYEGWCEEMKPLLESGKPVLAIEYTDEIRRLGDNCVLAENLGISLILKHRSLDAYRKSCD